MKYLKYHPITESKKSMQELLDEIDNTVSGQDLKALCNFDPKISGRIYVRPIGGPGSKTFIEKDPAGQYIFASLSNGVPFGTQVHQDAETAFRNLWVYIISKNAPSGYKKKDLTQWLIDPNNPLWGKGKGINEILENFRKATSPAGMAQKEDFFTDPFYSALPSIGIIIDSSGRDLVIRPEMLPGEKGIVDFLEEFKSTNNMRSYNFLHAPIMYSALNLNVIPKKIFDIKSNRKGNIGCLVEDVPAVERKILMKIRSSLENHIGRESNFNIYNAIKTVYKEEVEELVIALYEACIKNRIQMIDDFLAGKINTGFNQLGNYSGMIEIMAKSVQDVTVISKVPPEIARDIFIAQGYTEGQIRSLLAAGDLGIF
jgi:hypothetical protein